MCQPCTSGQLKLLVEQEVPPSGTHDALPNIGPHLRCGRKNVSCDQAASFASLQAA